MSAVRIREVPAEISPIRSGFFLRAAVNIAVGLQPGSIVEVDGSPCVVKYLIPGEPTEAETWAILLPVRSPVEMPEAATIA
jgi:hypothetical protein